MLIAEITKDHKAQMEELEIQFNKRVLEAQENEKLLKKNIETLTKYSEELEKERTHERSLRLKLEEEYMQNTKNHEEEVQLRLKFESKLNNMHALHRELQTKYTRAEKEIERQTVMVDELSNETATLKLQIAELRNRAQNAESNYNYA